MSIIKCFHHRISSLSARCHAAALLRRDDTLILDTETTDLDGYCLELSIIRARTGAVLLNTVIAPRAPISPQAISVHRITAADLTGAPTWTDLAPRIIEILHGRTVLAYNSAFDAAVLDREWVRAGVPAPSVRWECLHRLRLRYQRTARWQRLGGGHRALGDCLAARELLHAIAAGRPTARFVPTPPGQQVSPHSARARVKFADSSA